MNIIRYILVLSCLLSIVFCKRELSRENGVPPTPINTLLHDAGGACLPFSVHGAFVAQQAMTDSNYLTVDVHVVTTGEYLIETDQINGYTFRANGTFTDTGVVQIKLAATGTPENEGQDHFTLNYGTTSCTVDVIVQENIVPPAGFTLAGAPGQCAGAVVEGGFIKDYPLDTNSKVHIQVEVTTPGTYAISTSMLNGYFFTGKGVFTMAGPQELVLYAQGQPVRAGNDVFSIQAGGPACTFTVAVTTPLTVTGTDYFPLDLTDFWVYSRNDFPSDSVKRTVVNEVTQNGNTYRRMDEYFPYLGTNPLLFRKEGNNYLEYCRVDKYTTSMQYGTPVEGELLFLKQVLATGESWQSDEFTGIASFGQEIRIRYLFFCDDANASVKIGNNTFGNVYKIRMVPQIASVGNAWSYTFESYTFWYARGIGLLFSTKFLNQYSQYQQPLVRWGVK